MSLNAGLTTLHEDDIAKHQAVAQGLVTKVIILEADDPVRRHGACRNRAPLRLHRLDRRPAPHPRSGAGKDHPGGSHK